VDITPTTPWTGKCAQCGKPSSMRWVRIIKGVLRIGEFCAIHGPKSIWQSSASRRAAQERRMWAQTGTGW
jgi:hypothetical protein